MALAPFFDKAALAAAAVLQGFDRERFAATLEAQVVALAFDSAAARSTEARITLTLAVNLAARLYPALTLIARGDAAEVLGPELETIARAVNPHIALDRSVRETSADALSSAVVLVVGESDAATLGFDARAATIYVGSRGWESRVSTAHPVGSGATVLPFGAAAAACLGAANVFRHVFRAQLPHARLDDALTVSTLSLLSRPDVDPVGAPPLNASALTAPVDVDLGEAVLVGAGAVGQGLIWTLARLPGLRGTLHVVDPEAVDASNPQRYVLATSADEGTTKVALAAALVNTEPDASLTHGTSVAVTPADAPVAAGIVVRRVAPVERAQVTIVPHAVRWGQFLAERPQPWRLGRVLVAVDSARDRIAVQAALPRWIANAWTQPGDLGISRHAGFGESSCLACLYLPNGVSALHEDVLVAEAVGLSGQHMLVRHLLATNAPVDDAVLAQMAAGLGVPVEPFLAFRGRPLRAFYAEAVCGGAVLRLQSAQREQDQQGETQNGGQPRDRAAMVPMAFQSVLAGVLLAAAIVAEAAGLEAPPPGQKAVLNLLRPITARLLVPVARHPSGKCLCQDADFQAAFEAQWASPSALSRKDGSDDTAGTGFDAGINHNGGAPNVGLAPAYTTENNVKTVIQ
jgi:hypothetical protein